MSVATSTFSILSGVRLKSGWTLRAFIAFVAMLLGVAAIAQGQEETREYPLGAIGGTFRVTPGAKYARITSITQGAPGAAAGLQVNDILCGAFGKPFTPTGSYHYGVTQDLGFAIDRAEGADGALPLTVLRSGVGTIQVTVNLPAAGAFGGAYPRNNAKHQQMFEAACADLHTAVMNGNGNIGYVTGWAGLALLGHPNWNDTTGDKPYRLSINKIRDYFIKKINEGVYAAVEDKLLDGTTANPNYTGGPSNWELGQYVMFLSEYYSKTTDATVRPAIQRGAEMCANSVQWWKQPPLNANGYSPGYDQIAGMVSHGGVTGDYIHLGWGGGINICGVHGFSGMAFAKRVGADMSVTPRDGHYFGYAEPPAGAVPAGMEHKDHSLTEKFQMQWNWMSNRCAYYNANSFDDGHVAYTLNAPSGYDAAGRTPGTLLGMLLFSKGENVSATDQDRLDRMKGYITRHFMRQQEAHAFCVGAQAFHALCTPYLSDRQQRYAMDNWRFFYALSRTHDGKYQYVRARTVNDSYLNESHCAAIDVALPYAIANGGLDMVPGYNTNRVIAEFQSPDVTWPSLDARKVSTNTASIPMPVRIVDGFGQAVAAANYTATWTKVSGPGTVTFSAPSAATTNITFGSSGMYRVQLVVTKGGYTLTEPIDVVVQLAAAPPGYTLGQANYQVYTDIAGTAVSDLTSAAKFPNSPDVTKTVTKLVGDYSGSNFGARLSGCIVLPISGTYRFYIASDDTSQLKLNSTGMNPAGATVVASVPGFTAANEWKKYPAQESAEMNLTAGTVLYFEALHKEGGGGENLSVGWSINGGAIEVIDGVYTGVPTVPEPTTMSITQQPQSVSTTLGSTVVLSIVASGPSPAIYQWRRNGVPFGPASASPSLTLANVSGAMDANFDCVFTTPLGSLTSDVARVTITDAGNVVAGGLWREVYNGIDGGAVADLTSNAKYPYLPDSSGAITSAEAPAGAGDSYGQRWTGWLCPTESASYKFYLACDDSAELWLSTDDKRSHKVKIALKNGYTGERQWSSGGKSGFIALQAGQRYYIEVLHKEGGGGDHCSVAWQKSTDPVPANGSAAIPGQFLQYKTGGEFDNSLPIAVNDAAQYSGSPVVVSVLANDTDPDTDPLTVTSVAGGSRGAVTTNGTTVTYTPGNSFMGHDEFTYTVSDGFAGTATASVTIDSTVPITRITYRGGTKGKAPAPGDQVPGDVGSTFQTFGIPAISDAGNVAFLTTMVKNAAKVPAVFDGTAIVATKRQAVSDISNAVFAGFKDPAVNADGKIAFLATIANAPKTSGAVTSANNLCLVTNVGGSLKVAVRKNDEISTGRRVGSITAFQILDDAILFTGKLVSATDGGFALCLWTPTDGVKVLLREGSSVDGKVVTKITALLPAMDSPGHGRNGITSVHTSLARVTYTDGKQAVVSVDSDGATVVASAGAEAIGGAQWAAFGLPTVNENGEFAFAGSLAIGPGLVTTDNQNGIFAGIAPAQVVRKGEMVEGLKLVSFKDPITNAGGDLLFQATLTNPAVKSPLTKALIYVPSGGAPKIAARIGGEPADVQYGKWKSFKSIALPDGLGPVVTGFMARGPGGVNAAADWGLWAQDSGGTMRLLLREGDVLSINGASKKVKSFTVLSLVPGSPGQTRAFNRQGQLAVKAVFSDGSQGIVRIAVP